MANYTLENDKLTLLAKGQDILANTNTAQFNGLARQMTGNFDHVAFLTSQQNTSLFAKAGICVFEKPIINGVVDATTKFGCLVVVPNGQLMLLMRTGGDTQITQVGTVNKVLPLWLRFKRTNNDLVVYYSQKPLSFIGDYAWQQVVNVTGFFNSWTQCWAGMMGLSHDENATSTVVFQGLNFNVGQPYSLDFDISEINWSRKFSGLSALIKDTNPSNKSLEYSKDGQNWTTSTLFQNLTEGSSYTFSVRDANKTDAIKTKTDTAPASGSNSIAITSLAVSQGSTSILFNVTVNTSNPDVFILEYRMDNGTWKNNGIFTDVSAGSHTFEVRNRDNTTFVRSKTQTIGSSTPIDTTTPVSYAPKLVLEPETYWNRFQPDLIPDFEIPKKLDPITGLTLPVRCVINHAPYLSMYGNTAVEQLTKIFKKGYTAINASNLPPYYEGMENLITGDRIVMDDGLGENGGNKWTEEQSYENFANFCKRCFGYAPTFHQAKDSQNRWKVFLSIVDYENFYTKLNTQEDANYHVVGFDAGLSQTTGYYGFQYALALSHGAYATHKLYDGTLRNAWSVPADNSVPVALRGKSLADNPRNIAVSEMAYTFETLLPEGYIAKDQTGANWIVISHFGAECDNTYGYNSIANAEHWATQLGATTEQLYKEHHPNQQKLILQIKPTNERDNGFHYSSIHPEWQDGKWLNEYNRYGITYLEPYHHKDSNGNWVPGEALNPIGSEYITNFISEAQVALSFFSGAWGLNWWSSDFVKTAIPRPKTGNTRRGAKYNDPSYGNRDLECYTYFHKGLWTLAQKVKLSDGREFSFFDICDGSEIILLDSTKVIYPNSTAVQQLTALEWQLNKRSPVRAVVNKTLNVVFVLAFQAYAAEDSQVTFVYNEDGNNVSEIIQIPANEVVIRAFPLSNSSVAAPTITSNPTSPVAGNFVTFSAGNATGTISWYVNGVNANNIGSTFSVANPLKGDIYTAKRTVDGVTSSGSNQIKVQSSVVPVFIFLAESNGGTRNSNDTALAGDYGTKPNVRIYNNNTGAIETINIPTNSSLAEYDHTDGTGWGWEVPACNLFNSNGLSNYTELMIIKAAQGSARIGNWNENIPNGYYTLLMNRISAVKTQLTNEGKTPKFFVFYTQGLNNALFPNLDDQQNFPNLTGNEYWKQATITFLNKIIANTSADTKICLTKFWGNYGTYLNTKIDEIVSTNTTRYKSVNTDDLGIQPDGLHFNATATKALFLRMWNAMNPQS